VRIPRDLSGANLVKALERLGYRVTRQTGSHLRLTTAINGEHHVTVPNHDPLRMGTLAAVLTSIADHHGMTRDALLQRLLD
jgi:predicted RNA binding protein YcfA (HicA-like mRNA interferase family)